MVPARGANSSSVCRSCFLRTGSKRDTNGGEVVRNTARHRILIVDDNQESANSLAKLLEIMGNETQMAHDGLEALDLAAAFRPEIVLLDIGMPKMNGYETARRIREQAWGKQHRAGRPDRLGSGRGQAEVAGGWFQPPHGQAGGPPSS